MAARPCLRLRLCDCDSATATLRLRLRSQPGAKLLTLKATLGVAMVQEFVLSWLVNSGAMGDRDDAFYGGLQRAQARTGSRFLLR
jgi:hypothetical protein